jgi:hypothetical protein
MEISLLLPVARHKSRDIRGIFVFFAVFQNNNVFIPQFLEEIVTIFCVMLGFRKTFLGNTVNWYDCTALVVD